MKNEVTVVVGAGLAGWSTIRELRKHESLSRVVLVTADNADFYSKPSLSNALAQKRALADLVTTPGAQMAQSLGVLLFARTRLHSIDLAAKSIQVLSEAGEETTLRYTQLVLATGARPVPVQIEGDSDAIVVVNNLEDYRRFHARLCFAPRRVLIMGAGLIGCEFADDLIAAGHAVHVVDPATRVLAATLPEAAGECVQRALSDKGVQWHFESTVRTVRRAKDGTLEIMLSNGVTCAVDVVLSAVGLGPNIGPAREAGIVCDRGVVVDAYLETSAAGVYALGDVAQYAAAGNQVLPFVMPILQAARALGATLAGRPATVTFPVMPVTIKTPSLPVIVAVPARGSEGAWNRCADANDAWSFIAPDGRQTGFALLGAGTARRAEMLKITR